MDLREGASMTSTRHTSNTDDWRSPLYIVEPSRLWLGGVIDLDPASSEEANLTIGARSIFTCETNGFTREWWNIDGEPSTVFLNPPGGLCDALGLRVVRGGKKGAPGCEETGACGLPPGHTHTKPIQSAAKAWWFKLADEWKQGRVKAAVFLGFSIEIMQTTQVNTQGLMLDLPHDFVHCYPRSRVAFTNSAGKRVPGNTHASIIIGLHDSEHYGAHRMAFSNEFSKVGKCISPI